MVSTWTELLSLVATTGFLELSGSAGAYALSCPLNKSQGVYNVLACDLKEIRLAGSSKFGWWATEQSPVPTARPFPAAWKVPYTPFNPRRCHLLKV
jgi:hypothetical protein